MTTVGMGTPSGRSRCNHGSRDYDMENSSTERPHIGAVRSSIGRLATLGSITTSVVYSSTLPGRPIAPA
ncbi:hypothetical protein CH299_13150 [Rhodococcus sp. 14-2686-1-2]|nr:hypothetical protein CH301_12470 [Rhodococcus sp. 15-1189-1-1a]OZF14376.1 hypothetical protein CH299_13150 [Rhodococcus sp. 14-2686-1-2]